MSQWFTSFGVTRPQAPARLFCIPSSGSSATQYRTWRDRLPGVELQVATLPGRERRIMDAPLDNLPDLLDGLLPDLVRLADRPFFLFGHSMGALVAFELARALAETGQPLPRRLFVSAYRSPERPRLAPTLHHLPDDAFIDAIRNYGGTPEAILAHAETMALLLPMMKADFKVHETHRFQEGPPLSVPITALAGMQDTIVPPAEMPDWKRHTLAEFELLHYPGEHFFIHTAADQVLNSLQQRIYDDLALTLPWAG